MHGYSTSSLAAWLKPSAAGPKANPITYFQNGIDHFAMDAFAGYKKAATDVLPEATTVIDPFHVVVLVETKLDKTRRRLQTEIQGLRPSGDESPK